MEENDGRENFNKVLQKWKKKNPFKTPSVGAILNFFKNHY